MRNLLENKNNSDSSDTDYSDDLDDSSYHDEGTPIAPIKAWDVFEVKNRKILKI